MAKSKKSKVISKRPYVKKSAKWNIGNTAINAGDGSKATLTIVEDQNTKEDNEIVNLYTIVEIIEGWNEAERFRNLHFLHSKYYRYFPIKPR